MRGGIEYHVVDLAIGLRKLGLSVDLLSTPVPEDYRSELRSQHGIEIHEVGGVRPGVYSRAYFRKVGPELLRLQGENSYDIIHGQEFGFGFWRPPDDLGTKLALTVHGTITTETALHPDLFRRLSPVGKLRALRRYGRRLFFIPTWNRWLDRSERILVDSQFTADELQRIRPRIATKVRKVPLDVEIDRYPPIEKLSAKNQLGWPTSGAARPNLITVGRLEWQKGHDVALRALAQLKDLPWRYWIVGEGAARDSIEALAGKLGIADRVELTGRVEADRKALMLAGADLFIWPERTHPAFGLVGLEAMLMNTPVVGARRGAIPEVIHDRSGKIFEGDNPEALARALRPLLAEPADLAKLSERLRERTLLRFTPEAMAQQTLEVYREMLA